MPLLLLTPLGPQHALILLPPNTGNDLILTLFISHAHQNTVLCSTSTKSWGIFYGNAMLAYHYISCTGSKKQNKKNPVLNFT